MRAAFALPLIREDSQLVWLLILLLLADIVAGGVISFEQAGGPIWIRGCYFGAGTYFAGVAVILIAGLRFKNHYSVAGLFWILATILTFHVWNLAIISASILIGWWSAHQPGWHLGVTAAIGLLPLLVAIWQLRQKLRRALPDSQRLTSGTAIKGEGI